MPQKPLPSDSPFECSRTNGNRESARVHVTGALDIATTPDLVRTLEDSQSASLVVLDMRQIEFMDCAGVHAIVDASARARQLGRRLLLLRGPESVDRLFTLTGTADQVEIA